jgi:hypothetical protein
VSHTPRMKAAQIASMEHMTGDVYRVGCDLEIELNAANAIIRQQQLLDEENLRLKERIKRLEEAGDVLANTQTYDLLETVNWRKAKEAKP